MNKPSWYSDHMKSDMPTTTEVRVVGQLCWEIENLQRLIRTTAHNITTDTRAMQSDESCPDAETLAHYARVVADEARQMAARAHEMQGLIRARDAALAVITTVLVGKPDEFRVE